MKRLCARVVAATVLDKPAAIAHARLVILGADNVKLHEELVVAGGTISDKALTPMKEERVIEALKAATAERAPASFEARAAELWPQHRDSLLARLTECQKRKS